MPGNPPDSDDHPSSDITTSDAWDWNQLYPIIGLIGGVAVIAVLLRICFARLWANRAAPADAGETTPLLEAQIMPPPYSEQGVSASPPVPPPTYDSPSHGTLTVETIFSVNPNDRYPREAPTEPPPSYQALIFYPSPSQSPEALFTIPEGR